jgi:hypothetical protein
MSETFSIDLTKVTDWDSFNQAMESYYDHLNDGIDDLAKELGVTRECALDVWYLRGRSRHTPELEAKLIRLHNEGNPPNVCEFS